MLKVLFSTTADALHGKVGFDNILFLFVKFGYPIGFFPRLLVESRFFFLDTDSEMVEKKRIYPTSYSQGDGDVRDLKSIEKNPKTE